MIRWWRGVLYRAKVRRVIRLMKRQGFCICPMCLGAELRYGGH